VSGEPAPAFKRAPDSLRGREDEQWRSEREKERGTTEVLRTRRLRRALEARLDPRVIATMRRGVVTLRGVVDSLDERDRARRTVSGWPGVHHVRSELFVGDPGA
jgi:hypothetical protein